MKRGLGLTALAAAVFLLPAGCLLAVPVLFAAPAASACTGAGPAVGVTTGPLPATVAGYPADPSLAGAAAIMQAAKDAGLDRRAQTIGVMVSMGESSLTPVDHGDAVGPDSVGWFQQRDPWGPRADRLDAYKSATMFFTGGRGGQAGLADIPGWESMAPTAAAHAVQRNADPNYYTPFWDPATAVVAALADVPVTVTPGAGGQTCTAAGPDLPVAPGSWVKPATGVLTSGFSQRINPVTGQPEFHLGQDIAAACGTPIYAAHDGDVIKAGVSSGFGHAIFIDHGGGLQTWYGHEYADGVEVTVGQHVVAGQEIGKVGADGQATGCHLHFQVMQDGTAIDPVPFMAAHGAPL